MLRQELYSEVKQLIDKCNRCGFCRAVCPSITELGWESSSPRGRMFLAQQVLSGEIPLSQEVAARLDQCLLCRNCMSVCPVNGKIDQVIMAFRRFAASEMGVPANKQLALNMLSDHRGLFEALAPVTSRLEHLVLKETPQGGGVFRLNKKSRVLPMLGSKPLTSQVHQVEPDKPVKKVAFFVGCYINYVGVNVGRAVLSVLSRNGVVVVVPSAQTCCGVPYFASGKIDKAVAMVRQNIDALEQADADAIIYACGSCGTGLREWAKHPAVGEEYRAKAARLETKTFEIGEYLVDQLHIKQLPPFPQTKRVTYHDSCHLAVGAGVKEQPRRLLQLMPNIEYVEMPEANTCCGMGGLFSLNNYQLSRNINDRKIKHILSCKAQIVTSGCPGCNLHIMDGLYQHGVDVDVAHYIELVNRSYECSVSSN